MLTVDPGSVHVIYSFVYKFNFDNHMYLHTVVCVGCVILAKIGTSINVRGGC